MNHELPAHSLELEQSVLGALLSHKEAYPMVASEIREDLFYKPAHHLIFQAMQALYTKGRPVNPISTWETLRDAGCEDETPGFPYLIDLSQACLDAYSVNYEVEKLTELWQTRELEKSGYLIAEASKEMIPSDALDFAYGQLMSITCQQSTEPVNTNAILDQSLISLVDSMEGRKETGLPTGYYSLDSMLNGMCNSQLIILAARPSMGKSALALNVCYNLASQGHKVVFFSLEMNPDEIGQRLIKMQLEGATTTENIRLARQRLGNCENLHVRFPKRFGLSQLQAEARLIEASQGLDFICVDYLQLMHSEGRDKYEKVSELTRGAKQLARTLNKPVMLLSQLSRAVEQRQDKRPTLSDLRDSGSIEEDANAVMFIYRDEYYNKDSNRKGIAEVILAKNRSGPTGSAELIYQPHKTKFINPLERSDQVV